MGIPFLNSNPWLMACLGCLGLANLEAWNARVARGPLPHGYTPANPHRPTMAHLSGVPVRPNSLRPPLAGLPASTRSRFSLGAPRQRRVTEATAAGAQHRRSCQTARAAPKEAAQPQRQPRGDDEDDRMGRKGRKGKSAAASMNEATLVRVNKALEDFRASDAEGSHPFASSSFGGCFCDLES